ncbi:MAG: response regulator [Bryobacteraceae bacterium]|jgi:CheY-like chemotaxis protein
MPSAPGRILVVDDERPLLRMLSLYLGRLGYSVTTAETTDAAWKLVEAGPAAFTVAVLDGSMSGMSMDDLALRMLRTDPALRVLAASGYPVDMTALAEAAPGRVDFLQKPFTPEMLATALRGLLGAQEEKL